MATAPKVPHDAFVDKIVGDPKQPPDTLLLSGYVGNSSEEGHTRFYFDPQLSSYVEIPDDAILHRQEMTGSPLGGSHVWIKRDATLIHGPIGPNRRKAAFLEGPLTAAAGQNFATLPAALCSPTTPAICTLALPQCGAGTDVGPVCGQVTKIGPACHPTTPLAGCHPTTPALGCHPTTPAMGCHPTTPLTGCHPTTPAMGCHPTTPAVGCPPHTQVTTCPTHVGPHCPITQASPACFPTEVGPCAPTHVSPHCPTNVIPCPAGMAAGILPTQLPVLCPPVTHVPLCPAPTLPAGCASHVVLCPPVTVAGPCITHLPHCPQPTLPAACVSHVVVCPPVTLPATCGVSHLIACPPVTHIAPQCPPHTLVGPACEHFTVVGPACQFITHTPACIVTHGGPTCQATGLPGCSPSLAGCPSIACGDSLACNPGGGLPGGGG